MIETKDITWINLRQALEITKTYFKGPHSVAGIVWAAKKGQFIRRDPDEFHWQIHQPSLQRYCEIANETTLLDIAKKLGTNVGAIGYLALKHGIKFQKTLNRKYLLPDDVDELIHLFYIKKGVKHE